jgi:CRISPR/Cas system-associated exonuclease Cas4 (RecB family)
MMRIVYFSLREQFLNEVQKIPGDKIFVTPSPIKADSLRSRLSSGDSGDVITIAKFLSLLMESLWSLEDQPELKRKSELLLIFGILRNKFLPDLSFEQFNHAYNLFSDLRSFTLNLDDLSSVLEEVPEVINNAVKIFWKILDLTGHNDEHGAYRKINDRLNSSPDFLDRNKTYIFWGFQHLNGQQIDLLKTLSSSCQVIIPLPLSIKGKEKRSDWISWIIDSNTRVEELHASTLQPKASWIKVNTREITRNLRNVLEEGDQVLLGVSKLSSEHVNLVPSEKVFFKISTDLLSMELNQVHKEVESFSGTHFDLINDLDDKIKQTKNFKYMRGLQLYKEALLFIMDTTDEPVLIDTFFVKLLSEVTKLNQPRTSFVPLSKQKSRITLKDVSSMEEIDFAKRVILCIDERFDGLQGLGQNYTESIQKILSSIGPIKRSDLDLSFKIWEFQDLFSHAQVVVLMNQDTLKHNLIWRKIFNGVDLQLVGNDFDQNKSPSFIPLNLEPLKGFGGSFSASKIQTFIDCPRKFYFSFVQKVFPDISLKKDFDPMTSGTIIHEIIENFFKNQRRDEDLVFLVKKSMDDYLMKKNITMAREVYLHRELIFNQRSLNGISFLRQISQITNEKIDWKIEESFKIESGYLINGRIDCLGLSSGTVYLFDFKSTAYSASTAQEVMDFESIQLWTYAVASKKIVPDFELKKLVMGYIVLDEPEASLILTPDVELFKLFNSSDICKVHKMDWNSEIENIENIENKLLDYIQKIELEKSFPSLPRKKTVCDYCELNRVCSKSETNYV